MGGKGHGGNATGLAYVEYGMGGKWLELLLGLPIPTTLLTRADEVIEWRNVRLWHKADIPAVLPNVRFWE